MAGCKEFFHHSSDWRLLVPLRYFPFLVIIGNVSFFLPIIVGNSDGTYMEECRYEL